MLTRQLEVLFASVLRTSSRIKTSKINKTTSAKSFNPLQTLDPIEKPIEKGQQLIPVDTPGSSTPKAQRTTNPLIHRRIIAQRTHCSPLEFVARTIISPRDKDYEFFPSLRSRFSTALTLFHSAAKCSINAREILHQDLSQKSILGR